MQLFSKKDLIKKLKDISARGWIKNRRKGNSGGIGNTLEDLLGIEENNLPIPNAAEWELKVQRANTTSLITLFHSEPSPRALKFVPQILLPQFGWRHQQAGGKYPETEMSFRQTINALSYTDRGFRICIDESYRKILVSFDNRKVSAKHSDWLKTVEERTKNFELDPQPYWGFDDLMHKAGTKLLNTFYVIADVRKDKETKEEFYYYKKVLMLEKFDFDGFIEAIRTGKLLIDFDARTGHNHGTKFRLRQNNFPMLYGKITEII